MVNTYHCNPITIRLAYCFWRRKCYCTIYLYTFLNYGGKNMKTDTSKSTILIISMGFLIIYLLFLWQWAVFVSLIVGVVGIISSFLSRKIEWCWMKLTKLLGYIIPNILLGIVFFFFLFPISLFYKLFSKDPLMLSKKYKSYFIDINKEIDKKSFEKTW